MRSFRGLAKTQPVGKGIRAMRNHTACTTHTLTPVSVPAPAPALPPAASVPGRPETAYYLRAHARARMPLPWGLWSDDGAGCETWINGNDRSEVWVFPDLHELIWINPGEETLANWPLIDSPMGYPSPLSPVQCAIPDCGICLFIAELNDLISQLFRVIGA